MPISIIKGSSEYCIENKLFFCFVLALMFICQYLTDLLDSMVIGPIIMGVLMMGYGLQVTEDILHGGKRLPKILPKKIISYGVKGYLIFVFYVLLQSALLAVVCVNLNFPDFEIEEFILNYNQTLNLFMTHDVLSFMIFVVSGFITVYITTFFMEIALARLADGGKLTNSFNFPRIKHAIDIIGWKKYAWGYTKIIISIVLLTHFIHYEIPVDLVDTVIDTILNFLIFVIEYIGIANVYKVYIDNKKKKVE